MVFFPNEKIELWEYQDSEIKYNIYGEPEEEYILKTIVSCDIQPMSPQDNIKSFGKILQDTYKIYLDKNTPITDTMIIRIVGKPDTYKITGTPMLNNHLLHHKKVILKKQRKPTPLPDTITKDDESI